MGGRVGSELDYLVETDDELRSGAFMAGALSGFGTMAAAATGSLCAGWISGAVMPDYAKSFTLARYDDLSLMAELRSSSSKGVL